MSNGLHAHHRSRLKRRFLKEGLSGFEKHNVLELLLFYAVPQKDTNELAHYLINHFGSFSNVCDAPVEELMAMSGIKENAAVLLKLIPELARLYCSDRFDFDLSEPTYEDLGEYFVSRFLGMKHEQVLATYLDSAMNIVSTETIFMGSLNSAGVTPKKMLESVVLKNVPYVILAHNHPLGNPIASSEDIITTKNISDFLYTIDITLLDHFVVAKNGYTSITKDFCISKLNERHIDKHR